MEKKEENEKEAKNFSEVKCCPDFVLGPKCDTLNLRYSMMFRPRVNNVVVPTEVVLHFLFKRCSGPLVLGDPVYSITLLPGEKVRLFTSDRHTQWSYDSESKLAYRHATTSVESFYTAGMAQAMSDLVITESGGGQSSYEESWAEGGGGASFSLFGLIEIGGGGGGGSYDAESAYSFLHSLRRHSESASRYVATSVRAKSAVSIGEVEHRSHSEGESEAHYESASRTFHNPNKCRALTYLFYQINKIQNISFRLVSIERRVKDPAAPTGAYQRIPVDTTGRVRVLPQSILATAKDRLEIEQIARNSAALRRRAVVSPENLQSSYAMSGATLNSSVTVVREPINVSLRRDAIAAVDKNLVSSGILNVKTGKLTERVIKDVNWVRQEVLPTAGVIVKGCLDSCITCEPALQKEISLKLERMKLENDLLKKQTDLLEKSQEYRCCPIGNVENGESDND
jgi:hypothetical protein